jgi:hypothetical protein
MSVLKDVAAISHDAAQVWTDVIRYKIQKETLSVKRAMLRFLAEALGLILAVVFFGVGLGLILTGCRILLAQAMGNGGGTLLLGVLVTVGALIVALVVVVSSRKS